MEKKYFSSLKEKIDMQNKRDKEQKEFLQGMKDLKASQVDVMDTPLTDKDVHRVVSPQAREAKVEAYRAARRKLRGIPEAEENVLDYGDFKKGKKVAEESSDVLDYKQLRKAASKLGRRGLKALPIVGGLASAFESGDVSAAIPGLDMAESTGPEKGSIEEKIESATATEQEIKDFWKKSALMNIRK